MFVCAELDSGNCVEWVAFEAHPFGLPPITMGDALAFSGAVLGLYVVVFGIRLAVGLFNNRQ